MKNHVIVLFEVFTMFIGVSAYAGVQNYDCGDGIWVQVEYYGEAGTKKPIELHFPVQLLMACIPLWVTESFFNKKMAAFSTLVPYTA
jgi:hypothetical protein